MFKFQLKYADTFMKQLVEKIRAWTQGLLHVSVKVTVYQTYSCPTQSHTIGVQQFVGAGLRPSYPCCLLCGSQSCKQQEGATPFIPFTRLD